MPASDLSQLATQDLKDVSHALEIAVRQINIMSETASRFINLEKRIDAELQVRKTRDAVR